MNDVLPPLISCPVPLLSASPTHFFSLCRSWVKTSAHSCVDTAYFICGSSVTDYLDFSGTENSFSFAGFACEDPACFDPDTVADFPGCAGDWLEIGDGTCTPEDNNALFGYDGGNCCLCSCSGPACASSPFDFKDPSAYGEFFNCEAPPPPALPCSPEVPQTWVGSGNVCAGTGPGGGRELLR